MFMRTILLALAIITAAVGSVSQAHAQRMLKPGQMSRLATIGIDGQDLKIVYETTDVIEAPNWSPDGHWLVFNSRGSLFRIAVDGKSPAMKIDIGDVKGANNDHVISPDGSTIYFSAEMAIYAVPFEGGQPRRVTNDHPDKNQFRHYLHGISADGKTLAYVGMEIGDTLKQRRLDLYTIPAEGGTDVRLTDTAEPDDGPEFSPDGKWIYFNSELNATKPGHSQCYRMKTDGTGVEQLTHDERVNWFPHISPDGQWIVYLSYPPGTENHPADKDVILRRMRADGSEQADIVAFLGGQGTINVNSWAPDSRRFAFVMYPES
jgi:TolB protein